jgi:FAD:protein FMN transferase
MNIKKTILPLFVVVLLLQSCGDSQNNFEQFSLSGTTMGTTYSVKVVYKENEEFSLLSDSIQSDIDSLLKQVNQEMSTYIPDSEISLFNKYNKSDWYPISIDFANVLEMAFYISDKSGGAFDITVGPIVNLWGFGPDHKYEYVPSQKEIDEGLKSVGYENLNVVTEPPALKKKIKTIYCDLSAIAKGFGVDKVSEYLESKKLNDYMVEIGGEVRTKGNNIHRKPWQIGVSTPDDEFNLQKVLSLTNNSIATSGDYRNYFEKDGVRYSHTIDPRTGKPIKHTLASVTVVHGSCMIADGMATAITVMGPEAGYEFALKEELPIFMIVREGNEFVEKMTPSFEQFLTKVEE